MKVGKLDGWASADLLWLIDIINNNNLSSGK